MNQTEKESSGDTVKPAPVAESSNSKKQFGISALFWVTFIVGLSVAYLQKQASPDILVGGLVSVVIGLAVGAAVGFLTGRSGDTIFWAMLIAAFAYISTAGDPVGDLQYRLSWATVGAVSGAISAAFFAKQMVLNALACALSAGLVMLALWLVTPRPWNDMQFDLYAAPVIGVAVAFFLQILVWLESKHKMPRYITATWLLVVVIIGSAFSR